MLPRPVPEHPHHEPERDSDEDQREHLGVEYQFHGDGPSFRFPHAGSPKNGSRATESSMNPEDAFFAKEGVGGL